MLSSASLKLTLRRLEQPSKALRPIDISDSGMLTEVMEVRFLKQLSAI